ncbi:signal peptidase II [Candidatus Woesearchaeota archaeon]|jgi:signal peptidase II|nr:signal peptidase II [Candidatus Woesearchaeota archaeon]MBT3536967.1 signal peptidase II [Candidatus Woesearchaeota archaeon]MBT4697577.1 signal peptidase II [Candidatus Woesearchaeota archaeon]MBT4717691.1 signal peptidase II [Candidatus Woesearchaeota archaeon]MBT7106723.1 signal peptidase II [Candidatus Woesearchaeota archaeon]
MNWFTKLGKDKVFLIFTPVLFLLDILSKLYVKYVIFDKIKVLGNLFSINYHENLGAGFSILYGKTALLILVSVLAVGFIFYYYRKIPNELGVYVVLILAGILGNLFDRVFFGYVIDFLDFIYWPVFNFADIYITVGALCLVFLWKDEKKGKKKN